MKKTVSLKRQRSSSGKLGDTQSISDTQPLDSPSADEPNQKAVKLGPREKSSIWDGRILGANADEDNLYEASRPFSIGDKTITGLAGCHQGFAYKPWNEDRFVKRATGFAVIDGMGGIAGGAEAANGMAEHYGKSDTKKDMVTLANEQHRLMAEKNKPGAFVLVSCDVLEKRLDEIVVDVALSGDCGLAFFEVAPGECRLVYKTPLAALDNYEAILELLKEKDMEKIDFDRLEECCGYFDRIKNHPAIQANQRYFLDLGLKNDLFKLTQRPENRTEQVMSGLRPLVDNLYNYTRNYVDKSISKHRCDIGSKRVVIPRPAPGFQTVVLSGSDGIFDLLTPAEIAEILATPGADGQLRDHDEIMKDIYGIAKRQNLKSIGQDSSQEPVFQAHIEQHGPPKQKAKADNITVVLGRVNWPKNPQAAASSSDAAK